MRQSRAPAEGLNTWRGHVLEDRAFAAREKAVWRHFGMRRQLEGWDLWLVWVERRREAAKWATLASGHWCAVAWIKPLMPAMAWENGVWRGLAASMWAAWRAWAGERSRRLRRGNGGHKGVVRLLSTATEYKRRRVDGAMLHSLLEYALLAQNGRHGHALDTRATEYALFLPRFRALSVWLAFPHVCHRCTRHLAMVVAPLRLESKRWVRRAYLRWAFEGPRRAQAWAAETHERRPAGQPGRPMTRSRRELLQALSSTPRQLGASSEPRKLAHVLARLAQLGRHFEDEATEAPIQQTNSPALGPAVVHWREAEPSITTGSLDTAGALGALDSAGVACAAGPAVAAGAAPSRICERTPGGPITSAQYANLYAKASTLSLERQYASLPTETRLEARVLAIEARLDRVYDSGPYLTGPPELLRAFHRTQGRRRRQARLPGRPPAEPVADALPALISPRFVKPRAQYGDGPPGLLPSEGHRLPALLSPRYGQLGPQGQLPAETLAPRRRVGLTGADALPPLVAETVVDPLHNLLAAAAALQTPTLQQAWRQHAAEPSPRTKPSARLVEPAFRATIMEPWKGPTLDSSLPAFSTAYRIRTPE